MTKAISIVLKEIFKVMGIAYCEHWGEVDTQKDLNLYKNLLNLNNNLEMSLENFLEQIDLRRVKNITGICYSGRSGSYLLSNLSIAILLYYLVHHIRCTIPLSQ